MSACPDPGFRVSVQDSGEPKIVTLRGELDLESAPLLRECLDALTDGDGHGDVVLDLAEMAFVDSPG